MTWRTQRLSGGDGLSADRSPEHSPGASSAARRHATAGGSVELPGN